MNIFQSTFTDRLTSWRDLRVSSSTLSTQDACIAIDRWWQQAPLVNNHIHWNDTDSWLDPWSLLSENTYCRLTRALGICYTLLMAVTDDVELVIATDNQCDEHFLVLVDGAKYTMNYYPDSVISTHLQDFTVTRKLSLEPLKNNIK